MVKYFNEIKTDLLRNIRLIRPELLVCKKCDFAD